MKRMVLLLGAVLMSTGLAHANLVVNGGFEDPANAGTNNDQNPNGWSVFETDLGTNPGRQVRTRSSSPAPYEGALALQFNAGNSDPVGQIWQTVTTTAGQEYGFEMWAATFRDSESNPGNIMNLKVELRDGTGTNGTVLASFDTAGTVTTTWQQFTDTVTASSSALTIHISDITSDTAGNDVDLDNVSLVAIPEPATLGLIAVFGGGILFIRRRFTV
ncbi:PEP-CTERM sorting domain-containing protein [Pontiellaceae bacterium B1224]|nr:PEP-CTERM sorting domain-containing protein [Pontiellaceae bacterium B1224]